MNGNRLLICFALMLMLIACSQRVNISSNGESVSINSNSPMMEVKCYSGGQVVVEDRTSRLVFSNLPYYVSDKTKRKVWLTEGMSCTISEL